jgi:LCP family protein required for cell wall assembly
MDMNNRFKADDVRPQQRQAVDGFLRASVVPAERPIVRRPVVTRRPPVERRPGQIGYTAEPENELPILRHEAMPLPRYQPPVRPLRPVKKHRARRLVLRSASVLLAVFLATGGFLAWKGYSKLHQVFQGTTTVAALTSHVDPNLLKGEGDGRVNILLLGIGGPQHEGPDLTDTMMILSVDPVNNTAILLSVPRDLWVKMPVNFFGNYQKINAAYESGKYAYLGKQDSSNTNAKAIQAGFAADDTVLEQVLGIHIHYHMLVNFEAFRQAIDTVGGVTVDVQQPLYDPTMAWENGNNPVLAPAGVQTMDGKEALLYARSRETSSDFARADRQRQILVALKDKVLTAGTLSNPAKIDGLLNAFGDNIYSDLSTKGAEKLYGIMKKVNDSDIHSIGLTDPLSNLVTTDHVGNISVVRPRAGFNSYTAIQQFVRSQLPDGYILKEHAPIVVVSDNAMPGQATAASKDLKSYGYNVISQNTVSGTDRQTTIIDVSAGRYPYTRHYLEQHFKTPAITTLPANLKSVSGSLKPGFVILVGEHETVTQ